MHVCCSYFIPTVSDPCIPIQHTTSNATQSNKVVNPVFSNIFIAVFFMILKNHENSSYSELDNQQTSIQTGWNGTIVVNVINIKTNTYLNVQRNKL